MSELPLWLMILSRRRGARYHGRPISHVCVVAFVAAVAPPPHTPATRFEFARKTFWNLVANLTSLVSLALPPPDSPLFPSSLPLSRLIDIWG